MRIYIITGAYPPEPITGAALARDIAETLTMRGHDITVFAPFPNRPAGRLMCRDRRSLIHEERRGGCRIVHTWHSLSRRSTMLSRFAENISFGITSTMQLMRESRPDVVYLNTWPVFAQWLNVLLLHRYGVPVVCAVKDLYPETLSHGRQLSPRHPFVWLARTVTADVYRRSAVIAPLNEIMGERIVADRGISPEKVEVLRDWIDPAPFEQRRHDSGFRALHGLRSDLFLAMYVGSMTRMANLEIYIEAAEILRRRKDIRILLVGDGAMRPKIEGMIRERHLDNIRLIRPLKPEEAPAVQAAADVLTLSLQEGAAQHATPSKMISYMFSERPIVAGVPAGSPAARLIDDARCGRVVHHSNPHEMAEALEKLAANRAALTLMGTNARHYAEEHFTKTRNLPPLCEMLERLANASLN